MLPTRNSLSQNFERNYHVQRSLPGVSCHESNTCIPKVPYHFLNTNFCIIFKTIWGSTVSTKTRMCWKIWGSSLGRNKRAISSPKHPVQLQRRHSLSGSKVARALSLIPHIHLVLSLQFSGAIHPLILSASVAALLYLYFLPKYLSQEVTSFLFLQRILFIH